MVDKIDSPVVHRKTRGQHAQEGERQPEAKNDRAAQLEAILDNIPEAVIVTDTRGHVQHANRMAETLMGKLQTEISPEDWAQTYGFYLDDGSTHFPGDKLPLARALHGETTLEEEMILRRLEGGKEIWVSMSAKPLEDDDNQVSGAIVFFRDIAYRKQIEVSREEHVRRTEALYQFSHAVAESGNELEQITQVVATQTARVFGDACVLTLLNPGGEALKIAAFHHPDPVARASLRKSLTDTEFGLDKGIAGGVIASGEPLLIPEIPSEQLEAIALPGLAEYIRENGVHSILIVPITGRGGTLGTIGIYRDRAGKSYTAKDQSLLTDISYRTALAIENCRLFESLKEQISEKLTAKDALDISEERFRSIFESTTLGIKLLDLEGNILQTNPAYQAMVGYVEEELHGRQFYSFHYPGDAARAKRLFYDLQASGAPDFRLEHRTIHKDGSIVWVKTTFTGVKRKDEDQGLAFIVGIVENITEQKEIEKEIGVLKNRLQDHVELERLRLAREIHDGPMQELYSTIYQIEELRSKAGTGTEETLARVKHDIQQVLQELRATAKDLRPPTISNFGLEKAIRSQADDFREKNPKIALHLSLAEDRQLLPENVRLALFRIYQHSLANVVRHAEATRVDVSFTFDAEQAYLEIADDGKGFIVSGDWVELVRKGHFGLAGVAERVDALGGTYSVESKIQEGTVIRVVIPYTPVEATSAESNDRLKP